MEDVKSELHRVKQENQTLENDLGRTSTLVHLSVWASFLPPVLIENASSSDKKAQRLAQKVTENQIVIEKLRREREGLTADHADLQRRFSRVTDVCPSDSRCTHSCSANIM